ncbi:MAG: hypothetical protein ACOCSR_01145 [Wenzhouxiangella sp.]
MPREGGALRFLFVPASGPRGTGEYYRCLTLARAIRRRCEKADIHFLLNRHAVVERERDVAYHLLDDTPSRAAARVEECIGKIRPDLALFDCSGRVRHFRAVRALGGRVAWLGDRPGKRRRGFRPRVLRRIDLHVIADSGNPAPALGLAERTLNRLFGPVAVQFISTIVPEAGGALPNLPGEHRPTADAYAVFAPGGGGYRHRSRPVSEMFLDAAARFHDATGLPVVVVMGPQYDGPVTHHPRVEVIRALPTAELASLLAHARLAVIGGGSMLSAQALTVGVPAVLVAVGGNDQPARLERYDRLGIALTAGLDEETMSRAAERLHSDPDLAARLLENLPASGIRNDAGELAQRLLALARTARQ